MRLSRTAFTIVAAGSSIGYLRRPVGAAEFTYRFVNALQVDHPVTIRAQQAVDKINLDSKGRLEIKVVGIGGSLGGGSAMVSQVRLGAVELLITGDNILQTVAPEVGITSVQFAFSGYPDAWRAVDGPLGTFVRNSLTKVGLYAFGKKWDIGMRQMSNSLRVVNGPDDLRGLKMRVADSPIDFSMYKMLGASPTPTSGADMYPALQTHLVDGMDLALIGVETYKLYELLKYVSLTNHSWSSYTVVANSDAWQRLPKNLRDLVESNLDAAAIPERTDMQRTDLALAAALKSKGLTFSQPDVGAFKAALRKAGFYAKCRDTFGQDAWSALEKSVGRLA